MKSTFRSKGLFALAIVLLATPAPAGTIWSDDGTGAVALLPDPRPSTLVRGARLECAEQRWILRLELDDGAAKESGARLAEVSFGSEVFSLAAEQSGHAVSVSVPGEVLPPLRQGLRMEVGIDGAVQPLRATFSLIGSRKVIDAIAPRCSKRDMSAYRAVNPSELYPEAALARQLLSEEIKAFRAATRSNPVVKASRIDLDRRELLFATLCGSSWYYGNSGCNLSVYARTEDSGDWLKVYETEGMDIYIVPGSAAPWPALVTLTPDGEEIHWRWQDGQYHVDLSDELPAIADEAPGGAEERDGG